MESRLKDGSLEWWWKLVTVPILTLQGITLFMGGVALFVVKLGVSTGLMPDRGLALWLPIMMTGAGLVLCGPAIYYLWKNVLSQAHYGRT
jgi:hypothetical protein